MTELPDSDQRHNQHAHPPPAAPRGMPSRRVCVIGGLTVATLAFLGLLYWLWIGSEKLSGVSPDTLATSQSSQQHPEPTTAAKAQQKTVTSPGVIVSPRKQQMMGVETAPVQFRTLTRSIRTVGLVEVDERRVEHVHTKLKGWIEKLYVKFTGEEVQKDQKLFEIYSPELVATQEEYLLALKAVRSLGDSEFPQVASASKRVLQSTQERFALWDITPNHIRDLEESGKVLRTLPLHAPMSGYVLMMHIRTGMYVTPEMDLYTLADLSRVWVLADLYEYEIQEVELGQEATITLPYFSGEIFKGKVTYIYPVLEPKTRTVKVRYELANPKWKLKPQMFANVEMKIPLGKRLVVPSTALLDSGTEQLVFIDKGEGLFEPRRVKTGVRTRDWLEITKGLKQNETVVTYGNFLIDSESSLKAATGMMHGKHEQNNPKGTDSSSQTPDSAH
jgi:Cu(I)/Ag(I) efflux system membrane fusion protein